MATIYERKETGTYYAKFYDADGKRVSRNTGVSKKREAQKIADGFEVMARERQASNSALPKAFAAILETVAREAASGELTLARAEEFVTKMHRLANPEYKETSLRDYWKQWIKGQTAHVTETTIGNYENDLLRFSEGLGEKVMKAPVRELTSAQVKAALEKLRKKGDRKGSTINLALASLRRVMESAVAEKLATHNPAKQCRSLSEADSTIRAPFTIAEIRAMLDHKETSDEWKGAITIAAHTGLRAGDVMSLSRKNVEGTYLVIQPSKTKKTTGKVITVPMTPACIQWIGEKKGDFFPTIKKQSKPTTAMQFGAIMKKAKVPKKIELKGRIQASRSYHSLRHTFASLLAEADIHADVRQKLTGHATSRIHQRYTHHDEALDRAVATLPAL